MVNSKSPGHVRAVVTFHWLVVSVTWQLLVANDLTKFSEHFLMQVVVLLISQSSVKQQYTRYRPNSLFFTGSILTYLLLLLPDPRGPMPDSPTHYSFLPDSIGIAISREGATIDLLQ